MSNANLPPDLCFPQAVPAARKRPSYRPRGIKYPGLYDAVGTLGRYSASWKYSAPWARDNFWVFRFDRPDGTKKYRVVTQFNGGYYLDLPLAPYRLYLKPKLVESQTIYVCEGEKVSDAACRLGLVATTSLGGPGYAHLSDWSPLDDKDVVVLRDFDLAGQQYADSVAQLALAAGARSARIVTLPGLQEGQDLVDWIGDKESPDELATLRAELDLLVAASPRIDPVRDQTLAGKDEASCGSAAPVADGNRCHTGLEDGSVPNVEVRRLSDVVAQEQDWVWNGVIPSGALTLIDGSAGIGKSFFTLNVAASVTRGERGPVAAATSDDDNKSTTNPAGVILVVPQDDLAKTVRPRLDACGADPELIFAVAVAADRQRRTHKVLEKGGQAPGGASPRFSNKSSLTQFDQQLALLAAELERIRGLDIDVRLIVIDPIRAFIGPADHEQLRSHVVSRLAEFANRTEVAIVMTTDAISSRGMNGPERSVSLDRELAKAAKSIFRLVRDPDVPLRRLLVPVKTNFCETGPAWACSLQDGIPRWEMEPVPDAEVPDLPTANRRTLASIAREQEAVSAVMWLMARLQNGPVQSTTVLQEGAQLSFSDKRMRQALRDLGGSSDKDGPNRWYWCLPGQSLPAKGRRADIRGQVPGGASPLSSRADAETGCWGRVDPGASGLDFPASPPPGTNSPPSIWGPEPGPATNKGQPSNVPVPRPGSTNGNQCLVSVGR